MSDNKVKLPKEVTEAIDREVVRVGKDSMFQIITSLKEEPFFNNSQILTLMMGTNDQKLIYRHFKGKLLKLADALVNGYEVEQTPEDKVKALYDKSETYAFKQGIIATLACLGIKISGVNE